MASAAAVYDAMARQREIQIAQKQSPEAIGKGDAFHAQGGGEIGHHALPAPHQNDEEADDDPGTTGAASAMTAAGPSCKTAAGHGNAHDGADEQGGQSDQQDSPTVCNRLCRYSTSVNVAK
jgi:hypothetical protein